MFVQKLLSVSRNSPLSLLHLGVILGVDCSIAGCVEVVTKLEISVLRVVATESLLSEAGQLLTQLTSTPSMVAVTIFGAVVVVEEASVGGPK